VSSPRPSVAVTVAVAIVTYGDRARFLSEVLEGVFSQTASCQIGRVVICDNGAGAESKVLLANLALQRPTLRVVTLPNNSGSARGFGEAIREAAASGCELVWCLDDDNKPYPDTLERLLNVLDSVEPGAALLSLRDNHLPQVRLARGASVEEAFGRQHSFLSFSILDIPSEIRKRLLADKAEGSRTFVTKPIRVPCAPYGGFLFRAKQVAEIGLPELAFYPYHDDEFTMRFVRRGYPIYLVPDSKTRDLEGSWHSSQPSRNPWVSSKLLSDAEAHSFVRQFYSVRNRAFVESRSLGWGRNASYWVNTASYLFLLFVEALLLKAAGQRGPWLSFKIIVGAAQRGWRGRLGRISETTLGKGEAGER
jgi:GT2 family glycosyltransferase